MTDKSSGKWVPLAEAARHFDKTERTIRRWIEAGKLESKRESGRVFVLVTDIETDKGPSDVDVVRLKSDIDRLTERVDMLSGQLSDTITQRDRWQQEADEWRKEAQALTGILENQRKQLAETTKPGKPWWKFWDRTED